MNPGSTGMSDPLIDEVRERRRSLFAQHGSDLNRLLEAIRELQRQHPEKVARPRKKQPFAPSR
jgi:hypothetical protein